MKDTEPSDSLGRISKFTGHDLGSLTKSWRHLQQEKEIEVSRILNTNVLKGWTRADVDALRVWAAVRTKLGASKERLLETTPAVDFLETFLLLEPTNAAVERDASVARLINEATSNKAGVDTVDNRIRVKLEGPPSA